MSKSHALRRLFLFVTLTGALAACVRDFTAPTPVQRKATRDSVQGDSTLCRSGFTVIDGKIVCNEMQ